MENDFINENSVEPIYRQIADWMIKNIQQEIWPTGYQLLSEEELSKTLNVSRGTLRKAISLLIEQGLLVRIQGKGTFVENNKISYPFAQELISFAESMEQRGYAFETQVLSQQIVLPSEAIQKRLDIDAYDSVLYIKRVRYMNGEPAIVLENWVVLKRCPGIEKEDFTSISLFQAMEKNAASKITYGVRHFGATVLNAGQAELLDLMERDPVLTLEQVTFGGKKEPLECSHVLLRTDKYEVTSVLMR